MQNNQFQTNTQRDQFQTFETSDQQYRGESAQGKQSNTQQKQVRQSESQILMDKDFVLLKSEVSNPGIELVGGGMRQMQQNDESFDIDDVINSIPFGKFQLIFLVIAFLHYINVSVIVYNYGFFLMYPPSYQCDYNMNTDGVNSGGYQQQCTREQICSNSGAINAKIDTTNGYSLNNWVELLNLRCSETIAISMFGTLDFTGQLLASLTLPIIADKYGKKYFTYLATYLQIILYLGMLSFPYIQVYYLSTFLLGIMVVSKNYVTYIHMVDLMGRKRTSFLTSLVFILDSVIFILCSLNLKYISSNTQIFVYGSLSIAVITGICLNMQRFPESSKFLWNKGRHQDVIRDVEYIYTIKNLLLMIFCWLASYTTFFLFNFYIKYLQGDIYLIGAAMGFSFIGYILSDIALKYYHVIKCLMISYFLTALMLFIILFMDPTTVPQMMYAFIFFTMKTFVCMSYSNIYVAHVVLFDAQILTRSLGFCGTLARIFGIFIPIIVEIENKQIPLMIVLVMNILAFVGSIFLKENKSQPKL
eukprot:403340743